MNTDENKKRLRHFDRVTLNGETLARIDSWIEQVQTIKAGVSLSRKDVLNWLVMNLPERLTATQEKQLSEKFYSELRYLQFATREIRAAETRGERITLKDLDGRRGAPANELPPKKPRKAKVSAVVVDAVSDLEAPPKLAVADNDCV